MKECGKGGENNESQGWSGEGRSLAEIVQFLGAVEKQMAKVEHEMKTYL